MESLKNLNVDPEFLERLKESEKSFAVEAEIRSGLMLAADQEKLDIIYAKRQQVCNIFGGKKDEMGTDDMLAFEKVYSGASKNPMVINRVDDIINSFSLVRDSEAYKAKIEGLDCLLDDEGLPIDSGRASIATHLTWLEKQLEPTGGRPVDATRGPEARFLAQRCRVAKSIEGHYRSYQDRALNPERYAKFTKEAGTELSP